jgi:transketolase
MCGDGCLMEGVSYEATSLAGHYGLNNLILLYDDNKITIDGGTDLTFTENTKERFKALNWNVLEVENGDTDIEDIYNKLIIAKSSNDKPSIIFVNTTIGYGSLLSGKSNVHGAPLGIENTKKLKQFFGFDENKSFFVDEDVKEYFSNLKKKNNNNIQEKNVYNFEYSENIINEFNIIKKLEKNYATRESSSMCLNIISKYIDNIIIGSADLGESNKTLIKNTIINKNNFKGKYLHYGIREHAMCSIANGISTYGIIPVVSTFLVFISYCLAPIRMASLSNHKVLYIFTHDSIFLGEDGPTHQPIESLNILRSIPNLYIIRPCDNREVVGCYEIALEHNGPVALILTRQTLNNIEYSDSTKMKYGGYIIYEPKEDLDIIIIATGSEVYLAYESIKFLEKEYNLNIRLISMPCTQLFDIQNNEYKDHILPKNIKKISIEAGCTLGWYKYANYVYGIDRFGESGKMNDLKEEFGMNVDKFSKFILDIL